MQHRPSGSRDADDCQRGLSSQRYIHALAACGVALGLACGGGEPTQGAGGSRVPVVAQAADPLDGLRLRPPTCGRLTGLGSLWVRLPVENLSDQVRRLVIQLEFLDEGRVPYGDRTTRRVLVVPPGEVRCLEATSAREKASTFAVVFTSP